MPVLGPVYPQMVFRMPVLDPDYPQMVFGMPVLDPDYPQMIFGMPVLGSKCPAFFSVGPVLGSKWPAFFSVGPVLGSKCPAFFSVGPVTVFFIRETKRNPPGPSCFGCLGGNFSSEVMAAVLLFCSVKKFPFCLSMSKIDEPNAMELAPIAEARMIFGRSPKSDFSA